MGSFTGCFTLFHALHIHQLAQIAKAFVVLRLGDGLFLQKGIQGFLLIPEQSDLLLTFLRHQVGMSRPGFVHQRYLQVFGGVLIYKSQLFLDTLGFFVSFVAAAPNAAHTQVRKGILQQCTGGFRNQSQKTGDGSLS